MLIPEESNLTNKECGDDGGDGDGGHDILKAFFADLQEKLL